MDKSVENFQESNFHYNTYSDTTNNHQLVLQSEDLFSSEEESTSEVGSLISEFSEEDQSELEEFINIDYDISENTRENLAAKIIEMHWKLKSRQDKIDKNEKFKSGRGRKRHSPFKTSAELRNFIIEYVPTQTSPPTSPPGGGGEVCVEPSSMYLPLPPPH